MPPQPSAPATRATPAGRLKLSEVYRSWRAREQRRPRAGLFWGLLVLVCALDAGVAALGVYLVALDSHSVTPLEARRIAVPYAGNPALWAPLHRWVVQEDGRIKPFETFCRESVRTITGREQFEGKDAVAVMAARLLLY